MLIYNLNRNIGIRNLNSGTADDLTSLCVRFLSFPHTKNTPHNGVRTSAVQEIRLQSYLSGERFSPGPVKY
jgi:hypothetical protein